MEDIDIRKRLHRMLEGNYCYDSMGQLEEVESDISILQNAVVEVLFTLIEKDMIKESGLEDLQCQIRYGR